jgi:transposase
VNIILIDDPHPTARCACCGHKAEKEISFTGPRANNDATLNLCDECGALLGQMLHDECGEP